MRNLGTNVALFHAIWLLIIVRLSRYRESEMAEQFFVVDPKTPIAGCLAVLVPESKYERLGQIESERKLRRFIARVHLSDHIPLAGGVTDVMERPLYHLVKLNEAPLSIYLHHGGRNAIYFDFVSDEEGFLKFIEVEVEAELPSMAFNPARTAVNELLDSLQRRVWLPLTIARIDLLLKGESEPFAHQIILPFQNALSIGPLGGIHQYPAFSYYEAVLREAIVSTSPYYRLLCAYRLYEGLNKLKAWMKKIADDLGVKDKLPKDRAVDQLIIQGLGLEEAFKDVRTISDLWKEFTDLRNRVAHFFLKDDDSPLHFSHGRTYYEYSLAGALLLHHANLAFTDLSLFFGAQLSGKLAKGTVLPMQGYRDKFVINT